MSIITDIETAIVAALATRSVTCFPYESSLLDRLPVATLMFNGFAPPAASEVDQAYGIGELEWMLRYYVSMVEGEKEAQDTMKTAALAITRALGTDTTLCAVAQQSTMGRARIFPATSTHGPELVLEAPFTVVPIANIGE